MPGRYARVYHKVKTDPKFETVYNDDHHFAWWLRLLIDADAAWPSYPSIPRRVRKASFDALVAVGLIDPMPGDCFRVHGWMLNAMLVHNLPAMRQQCAGMKRAMLGAMLGAMLDRASTAKQTRAEHTRARARARSIAEWGSGEDEDAYDRVVKWMAGPVHGSIRPSCKPTWRASLTATARCGSADNGHPLAEGGNHGSGTAALRRAQHDPPAARTSTRAPSNARSVPMRRTRHHQVRTRQNQAHHRRGRAPARSCSEADLFRGTPRSRTVPCACGGTVIALIGEEEQAVRAHRRTRVHRAWLAWQDML